MPLLDDNIYKKTDLRFCPHVQHEVCILSRVVHPADPLPDGPPRITKRECDSYAECTLHDKTACPVAVTLI